MKTTARQLNVLLILFLISIVSCKEKPSENPKQDVIGKWESADHSLVLEFTPDQKLNSFKMDRDGLRVETKGDAMFIEDKHIMSSWKTNTEIYEIKVYSNNLLLISPQGKKLKFKRINKSQ